jgi:hypothetical protein
MEKFRKLNKSFLNHAQKVSSFNLKDKDFEDLEYKHEIQFLYGQHFFPKFDWHKALTTNSITKTDIRKINALVNALRIENPQGYKNLVGFKGQALGPGEVLLYLLHDKIVLAGGTQGGDCRIGSNIYEVKGAEVLASTGEYFGFTLGGTLPLTGLANKILALKEQTGANFSKKGEVGRKDIAHMYNVAPDLMKDIDKEYGQIAYDNYFKKYNMLFLDNRKNKSTYGQILSVKKVKPEDVRIDAFTAQNFKLFVKG